MDSLSPLTATGQTLSLHDVASSDSPLIVHIDFKSPYAFLAIEPTRQMLKSLGVVADWRPFVLNIGSYLGTAKLAKGGKVAAQSRTQEQWSGVKYAYFDCRRYANLADLTIRGTVKIWNTNLPAIGMWWIKLHEDLNAQNQTDGLLQRYMDAIYLPFWRREFDAEDLDTVFNTLVQIGAPTEGFKAFTEGEGRAYNDAVQEQTFNSGVYGVPTYQLPAYPGPDGRASQFFGREHLPRIAWMLEGKVGGENSEDKAPDVAYELPSDIEAGALEKCASEPGIVQKQTGLPVYFDFKSPNSYLALPGLLSARDEGIALQWHPFDHKPLKKPAQQQPEEDRGTRHRRIRGEYIAGDLQRYAPHALHDPYLATDCDAANMGLLWLQEHAPTLVDNYVERVFLALWRDEIDIQSPEVIADLLDAVMGETAFDTGAFDTGARDAFVQGTGLQALAQAYDRAREQGVSYAPTFYLGSEPFQGRAQLPLILARLRAGV